MILIYFLIIIAVLTAIHELGHFLVAKCFGVKVDAISLGFVGRIAGGTIRGVEYKIGWIPFGAFINLNKESFQKKSIYKKSLIATAGILSSIIFAILIVCYLFAINSPTLSLNDNSQKKINNHSVSYNYSVAESLKKSVVYNYKVLRANIYGFILLIQGKTNIAKKIGPLGIVTVGSKMNEGFDHILLYAATLSLLAGFLDLLPILPLDGGMLILLYYQFKSGKIIKEKTKTLLDFGGIAFIVALFVLATFGR